MLAKAKAFIVRLSKEDKITDSKVEKVFYEIYKTKFTQAMDESPLDPLLTRVYEFADSHSIKEGIFFANGKPMPLDPVIQPIYILVLAALHDGFVL